MKGVLLGLQLEKRPAARLRVLGGKRRHQHPSRRLRRRIRPQSGRLG
jgi:hypothetical protein